MVIQDIHPKAVLMLTNLLRLTACNVGCAKSDISAVAVGKFSPSAKCTQLKAGMTKDEITPKRYINPKAGDVTEIYNYNYSVFMRLTFHARGMEIADSLSRHIPENQIRTTRTLRHD